MNQAQQHYQEPQAQHANAPDNNKKESLLDQTLKVTAQEMALNPNIQRERNILLTEREISLNTRRARMLADSTVIPKEYQGSIANCYIALEMAERLNAGELEVMQNLHIINGRPSFSASYLIARVNCSGILNGRLKFRMTGEKGTDSWGCIAWGYDRDTGEVLEGTEVTIKMAKDQGWWEKKDKYGNNSSKWPVMTEQMLQYRAAAFWSRINAPDATMGMHTVEESRDLGEQDINYMKQESIATSLRDQLKPANKVVDMETGEVTETKQNTSEASAAAKESDEAPAKQESENPAPGELDLEPKQKRGRPTKVAERSRQLNTLHEDLMRTNTENEVKALFNYGIYAQLGEEEKAQFDEAARARVEAFKTVSQ